MEKCNTEELYLLHRQRLLSLIQSKVEDSQKAEDLLHDSFIKLQTCCESYLFRTALNIVFDYIKRRKKKAVDLKSDLTEHGGKSSPTKETTTCDILSCINGFLDETSEENRTAFQQVDLLQIPQVQVAEELGVP